MEKRQVGSWYHSSPCFWALPDPDCDRLPSLIEAQPRLGRLLGPTSNPSYLSIFHSTAKSWRCLSTQSGASVRDCVQMNCPETGSPALGAPSLPREPSVAPDDLLSALLLLQVQALEQRNQLLETRWSFLQGQGSATFDLSHHYETFQSRLQEELRKVSQERGQLEANLLQVLEKVEEFRIR